MGLRFRRSIKVAPGVRVNVGKKSVGVSVGGKYGGVSVNSKTGTRARVPVLEYPLPARAFPILPKLILKLNLQQLKRQSKQHQNLFNLLKMHLIIRLQQCKAKKSNTKKL